MDHTDTSTQSKSSPDAGEENEARSDEIATLEPSRIVYVIEIDSGTGWRPWGAYRDQVEAQGVMSRWSQSVLGRTRIQEYAPAGSDVRKVS